VNQMASPAVAALVDGTGVRVTDVRAECISISCHISNFGPFLLHFA